MLKIYKHIMGKTSLSYAYRMLKENILRLDLKPGETIKDIDLQLKLEMSRTPIREAILLLKHDGLLETTKKGTSVKKIDIAQYEDGCVLRASLEKEVLRLACQDFMEESLAELQEVLNKYQEIVETTRESQVLIELDKKFHRTIFKGVGHENLANILNNSFYDYYRLRKLSKYVKYNSLAILEDHKRIFDIIKNKKTKLINDTLDKHYLLLDLEIEKLKAENPFYFY